jgi:hypothetical protein
MQLQLTELERDLIIHILSHRYRDLFHEVSKTSHRDFKDLLIKDERVLEILLEKLGVEEPLSVA